ncbi:MAG: hypothetical protein ACI33S_03920 [Bacilli bacterium]
MEYQGKISVLEDGKEYEIIDTLEYNNQKYILFSNILNIENICVRKVVSINNEEFFDFLDEIEFQEVIEKFIEKNKNLFE